MAVTAIARSPAQRRSSTSARAHTVRIAAFLTVSIACLAPARAQVSASVGLESESRFRGHAVSAGRPVATANIGYDDKSGVYLAGTGAIVLTGDDPGLLMVQGDIGFAKRVSSRVSIDAGVTHAHYTTRRGTRQPIDYTEIYAGVIRGGFSARLYYSPDYYAAGVGTLYGEANFGIEPIRDWTLQAHAGKLVYVANRPYYADPSGQYDWSLGVSRRLGHAEAHVAISGGGPGRDYYYGAYHDRTVVTAGITYSF